MVAGERKGTKDHRKGAWIALLASLAMFAGLASTGSFAESKEIENLRTKATEGDAGAQLSLAVAYELGRGVKPDLAKAARWYEAAARQGIADAQNSIGSLYLRGEGVPQDSSKACEWFAKAAAQQDRNGIGNLGTCFDGGIGVRKDQAKAAALYEQAAEAGDLQSMLNIGVDYWRAEGVTKDLVKAYMWLDLARFYTQAGGANRMLKYRARGALDALSREITPGDKVQAEALSRDWDRANRAKVQTTGRY